MVKVEINCPHNGKRCYGSEESANAVIESAWQDPNWRNRHGRMPRRAYRCTYCLWWHLTSSDKRVKEEAKPKNSQAVDERSTAVDDRRV